MAGGLISVLKMEVVKGCGTDNTSDMAMEGCDAVSTPWASGSDPWSLVEFSVGTVCS